MVPDKQAIFASVKARMLSWYGPFNNYGRCLYWMQCGLATMANEFGIMALPAAGSVTWQWPAGEWSCLWNTAPDATVFKGQASDGLLPLPEMHCWIFLPETREVIDFSLCELAQTIASISGQHDWQVEVPEFIWARSDEIKPWARYVPNADATRLAIHTILTHQ